MHGMNIKKIKVRKIRSKEQKMSKYFGMGEKHKPFHLTTNSSTTFETGTSAIQNTVVTANHSLFTHIVPHTSSYATQRTP